MDAKEEMCKSRQIHVMLSGWVICVTEQTQCRLQCLFSNSGTCSVYKLPTLSHVVLSLMKYLFETRFPFDFFTCILTRRDRG